MDDAFRKSASAGSVINRTGKSKKSGSFSPSFGVHQGLIKDPNWPPAQMPAEGTAAARRHRRVQIPFVIDVRGDRYDVTGDISQGGAMFLLGNALEQKAVDIVLGDSIARVEVLSISKKGSTFAHHCRFLNTHQGAQVWAAVQAL